MSKIPTELEMLAVLQGRHIQEQSNKGEVKMDNLLDELMLQGNIWKDILDIRELSGVRLNQYHRMTLNKAIKFASDNSGALNMIMSQRYLKNTDKIRRVHNLSNHSLKQANEVFKLGKTIQYFVGRNEHVGKLKVLNFYYSYMTYLSNKNHFIHAEVSQELVKLKDMILSLDMSDVIQDVTEVI